MNKYEKALDNVARYCSRAKWGIIAEPLTNELDVLSELVDKATPYKPTERRDYGYAGFSGNCKCGLYVHDHMRYCPDCSQALDWAEEKVDER